MDTIEKNRKFMKANFKMLKELITDQNNEIPQPPLQKPWEGEAEKIDLPKVDPKEIQINNLYEVIKDRRSHRKFLEEDITLQQLSFILWATQGVDDIRGEGYVTLRPVPSGGGRHPFETYIIVNKVEGLSPGLYRYLPLTHQLGYMGTIENTKDKIDKAVLGQKFVSKASAILFWSCIPYRSEWRYSIAAHKTMLLDAGHLCQNLYIACGAMSLGTCAIAAYNQEEVDNLLGLDGEEEFVVYLAPVGRLS